MINDVHVAVCRLVPPEIKLSVMSVCQRASTDRLCAYRVQQPRGAEACIVKSCCQTGERNTSTTLPARSRATFGLCQFIVRPEFDSEQYATRCPLMHNSSSQYVCCCSHDGTYWGWRPTYRTTGRLCDSLSGIC